MSLLIALILIPLVGFQDTVAPIPTSIAVSFPIHGYYAFDAENRLMMMDTHSGDLSVLRELEYPRPIGEPHWNQKGDELLFYDSLDTRIMQPFVSSSLTSFIIPYTGYETGVFSPQDWSPDDTQILGITSGTDLPYYRLQIVDVNDTNSRLTLKQYFKDELLPENPQFIFFRIPSAAWNPIFDQWIIAEIDTFPIEQRDWVEKWGVTFGLVVNRLTGETHLIDNAEVDNLYTIAADPWSPDGRQLLVKAGEFGTRTQILTLFDENGNWQFQAGDNAPDEQPRYISPLGWVGVDDLLLARELISDTDEYLYYIGRITNGQLLLHEFFRISAAAFTQSYTHYIGSGSWHLTPTADEQAALRQLFE